MEKPLPVDLTQDTRALQRQFDDYLNVESVSANIRLAELFFNQTLPALAKEIASGDIVRPA